MKLCWLGLNVSELNVNNYVRRWAGEAVWLMVSKMPAVYFNNFENLHYFVRTITTIGKKFTLIIESRTRMTFPL